MNLRQRAARGAIVCCAFLAAGLAGARAEVPPPGATRRLALVVGTNSGGQGRVALRYAQADAEAVARVLRQLGGVEAGDLMLVQEPDRLSLLDSLGQLRAKLESARRTGRRTELLFYYSGHSDEDGLLLGGQRLGYDRLRSALGVLPADVRIAVLDSCASGALTRGKGGRRRAPFLIDSSSNIRGHAYLTSASATESAQESDRLRGSFFTHALIAGLRGAADINHDGRVTLNEAYNHAFHETLARTESTRSGPQHPNYDMQLVGSGDLVMTDLRGTSALMVLAAELRGRLFIRDARGRLVAELNKSPGVPVSLGLEPGSYQLTLEAQRELLRGRVELTEGSPTVVRLSMLGVAVAREETRGRGTEQTDASLQQGRGLVVRKPVSISFAPGVSTNTGSAAPTLNYFSLNWTVEQADLLYGLELSMVGSVRTMDVSGLQLAGAFASVRGELRGLQISTAFNTALAGASGIQLSAGLNWAGPTTGSQLSMGLNGAGGRFRGLQMTAGLDLVGGDASGLQMAVGGNLVRGTTRGLQIGGAVNAVGGGTYGLQISGAVNTVREGLYGLQIAGALNTSREMVGLQLSGAVNLSREVKGFQLAPVNSSVSSLRGVQLGVVNHARRAGGLQLGVINIASESDGLIPIGLINVVKDGLLAPTIWSAGSSLINVGLKTGSRRFYGLLGVGFQPGDEKDQRLNVMAGLGTHLPLGRFWMDLDGVVQHAHVLDRDDGLDLTTQLRSALGFRIWPQLSVYAGPSLDLLISTVRERMSTVLNLSSRRTEGGTYLQLGLGFLVGIQATPQWGRMNRH